MRRWLVFLVLAIGFVVSLPVSTQQRFRLRASVASGSGTVVQFRTCTPAHGAFTQPANLTLSTVQTSVDNASDGDVICLPAGTATWTSSLIIGTTSSRTKMVALQGAGSGNTASDTRITSSSTTSVGGQCCPVIVALESPSLTGFELSNIRFTQGSAWNGTTQGNQENVWGFILAGSSEGTTAAKLFRVHHLHIEYNATSDGGEGLKGSVINFGRLGGNGFRVDTATVYIWGVFDHNTWHGGGSFQCIDIMPYSGNNSWAVPGGTLSEGNVGGLLAYTTPLSDHKASIKNVFFEDNTVTADDWNDSNACIDAVAGGTWVVRRNTFTNNWIGGHGNDLDHSVKWEEVYDNTFVLNNSTGSAGVTSLRGGTGVFYNNRLCDATHTCGLTITGSQSWPTDPSFELQYYRAYPDGQSRGINNGVVNCAHDNGSIPEAASTANNLGCDNFDHVSPTTDAGWLAGEQPGSRRGTSSLPTWVWGTNYVSEPVVAWGNYLGSGTSTKATMQVFNFGGGDAGTLYVQPRRDFISEDGTSADCTTHMGESVCATWWDATAHQKVGYTAFPYPHSRTQ